MSSIVVDPETQGTDPQAQPQQPQNQQDPPEDELPEKYRGKSLKDIIAMHQNAESELGRKNNEVGVIRKLADELIGVRATERQANQPAPRKPLTTDELLDDPENKILEVVREATERSVRAQEERVDRMEASLQVQAFERKYPGFQDTMQSQDFGSWLQGGSDYRKRLALRAADGDFGAADELFGLYNEQTSSRAAQGNQPPARQESGTAAARAASTVRSGGSNANGVVPGSDGKKTFSRSELLDMRINRPEEFDMRQDEILAAYREKRVR
jgi:hypothetical protein